MKKIVLSLVISLLFISSVNAKDVNEIELGSYVKYVPTETSYIPDISKTGCSEMSECNQDELNPSELTSWRVLKINDDGTVDIVSTNISSSTITFYGKTGFINYVNELQKTAAAYINSEFASSARSLGYDGQTLVITDTTALDQNTVKIKTFKSDNTYEELGGGDTWYLTDTNQMETAGIPLAATTPNGTSSNYWLASRSYTYIDSSNRWFFYARDIETTGSIYQYVLYKCVLGEFGNVKVNGAFRPIVTLKANLEVTGEGTLDSPYILSVKKETTSTIKNNTVTNDAKTDEETEDTTTITSSIENAEISSTSNETTEVANPKTGDKTIICIEMFVFSILLLIILICNRKNISKFKKI